MKKKGKSSKNNNIDPDQMMKPKQITVIKKKRKLKKKIKLGILITISIILLTVTLICIRNIISWVLDNEKSQNIIDNISDITNIEEVEDNENTENIIQPEVQENDYWYYIKFPLINVQFDELIKKNKDTVGWINVNNTNINYPYVLTDNNEFYLNHSFDKSYNKAGWVFLDYRNNSNLTSKNNILYAHNRLDKIMFGSLSKVLEKSWYNNKDNHIIRLSTLTENTLWQIFSVYTIQEESYYITTEFENDQEYQKFLDTIKERSVHNFNTNLNTTDKLLTLSTCYSDDLRTVVHAKLIKREKR